MGPYQGGVQVRRTVLTVSVKLHPLYAIQALSRVPADLYGFLIWRPELRFGYAAGPKNPTGKTSLPQNCASQTTWNRKTDEIGLVRSPWPPVRGDETAFKKFWLYHKIQTQPPFCFCLAGELMLKLTAGG